MRINLKTIVFLAFLGFATNGAAQQREKDTVGENQNVNKLAAVEVKPEFPGGMQAFYNYLGQNFKTTAEANKNKVQGKIYLQFIIEKDGTVQEVTILRDLGYGLGDEAVRVLKSSPRWSPGVVRGKPVRVVYSLPLTVKT